MCYDVEDNLHMHNLKHLIWKLKSSIDWDNGFMYIVARKGH